jgi:hypothetical protein
MRRFQQGWGKLILPITGKVVVIDQGEPAVGLSAMQLDALDIHSGVVRLKFGKKTCEAKVWNAYGMNSTNGYDTVRITDGVANALGCKVGDDIDFVKIIAHTLPVKVGAV